MFIIYIIFIIFIIFLGPNPIPLPPNPIGQFVVVDVVGQQVVLHVFEVFGQQVVLHEVVLQQLVVVQQLVPH